MNITIYVFNDIKNGKFDLKYVIFDCMIEDQYLYVSDPRGGRDRFGVVVSTRSNYWVGKEIIPYECHSRYVLQFIVKGEAHHTNHQNERTKLEAGDFFIRFPGEKHSLFGERKQEWAECFLSVGVHFMPLIQHFKLWNSGCCFKSPWSFIDTIQRFFDLYNFASEIKEGEPQELELYVLNFLNELKIAENKKEKKPNLIEKMKDRIQQNLTNQFAMDIILRDLGLSYSRARLIFKEKTGFSPGQYRLIKRMDLALSMLSDGDFRVSDVAEQLGYADVFTFSKQFKQIYKKSPKNFRQSDPILDSDWSL